MIVYDLKCEAESHVFEGWFASSDDFESQRERGLIACPICGDNAVGKAAMAPAVPRKDNQRPVARPAAEDSPSPQPSVPMATPEVLPPETREALQSLARLQAEALRKSQWVGKDFAEQARAMHYGERDKALIHGEATLSQARELWEEGVEVAPLLFPVAPPGSRN